MDMNFSDSNIIGDSRNSKVTIEKYVDYSCENITIDSELIYTIKLENISNFNLYDIYIMEDLIHGLKYKSNSLRINGVVPFGGDIDLNTESIIPIGVVNCKYNKEYDNSIIILTFKVIVDDVPNDYKITNTSSVNYKFNIHNKILCENQTSNTVVTDFCDESNNKTADLLSTLKKEITSECNCNCKKLDYTISFVNTGDTDAHNVCINDILNNASFELSSLKVFTNRASGHKPYHGELPSIYIDTVYSNEKITISFTANVEKSYFDEEVTNYAKLSYEYYKNNYCEATCIEGKSNLVSTLIKKALLVSSLSINGSTMAQAEVNNEVVYKILLKNTSSIQLFNVIYSLNLSNGFENYIKYKPNSLKIIGGTPSSLDINPNNTPINIGTIKPGESVIIEFEEITLKPTSTPIISSASGTYSYIADSSLPPITCNDKTNTANLVIIPEMATLLKTTFNYCPPNESGCTVKPITSAGVGDRVTYQIAIKNTSSKILESVLFNDELSSNLTYVEGSLKINGLPVTFDLQDNLPIGNINPNTTIVVSFDVIINSLPSPAIIDNTACINYEYLVNKVKCIRKSGKSCASNSLNIKYADLTSVQATKVSDTPVVSRTDPAKKFGNYILTLKNSGNIDALNVKVTDTLPSGLTFTPNSVIVRGVDQNGNIVPLTVLSIPPGQPLNIENGIIIEKIPPLVTVTIKYGYSVNSNAPDRIDNVASFDYSYLVDGQLITKPNNPTTTSTIFVVDDVLRVDKTVSPTTFCPDQTLLYSINIKNFSKQNINNIIFQDTLPNGTSLVPSSFTLDLKPFYINGNPVTANDLASGINIGSVSIDGSKIAQFQAVVESEGFTNPITNTANVYYTNTTIPSKIFSSVAVATISSNCSTPPPTDLVDLAKDAFSYCPTNDVSCVVKPITSVGLNERITYKTTIQNVSSIPISNIVFNDTLPSSLSYVANTLKVDGILVPSGLIPSLPIGNLNANSTKIVTFDAIVVSIPSNNMISNTACTTYNFQYNCPNCTTGTATDCASNSLNTKYADLTSVQATKVSDTPVVSRTDPAKKFGNYILTLKNSGNIDALNVKVTDTLPSGLTFTPNSVIARGVDQNGNIVPLTVLSIPPGQPLNIENGIIIEKIPPLVTVTIKYGYSVNSNAPDRIDNVASFDYSYLVDGQLITKPNNPTTTSTIFVVDDVLGVDKTVSPTTFCPDQTLLYSINIRNFSKQNINNIIFQDTLPNGTSLVPTSFTLDLKPFYINGNPVTANDLASGINIGSVTIDGSKIAQFQAVVESEGFTNPITNTANVYYTNTTIPSKIFSSVAVATISSNCSTPPPTDLVDLAKDAFSYCPTNDVSCVVKPITSVALNERITYKTTIQNVSSIPISNIVFNDTVPSSLSYVANTLKVDGILVPSGLIPSLPIGNLNANSTKIVTFDAIVVSIPSNNMILNTACTTYNFQYNCPNCTTVTATDCTSNSLTVSSPDLITSLKKYVDQVGVTENYKAPGREIAYIIQFQNTGNADALNVVFRDTIPAQVGYLLDSVTVTPSVPAANITQPTSSNNVLTIHFDTIPANQSYEIIFDTLINPTIVSGNIYDVAQLDYNYVSSSGELKNISILSNTVVSHVNSADIEISKSASASEVDINVPVTYTISIVNSGNIVANNLFITDILPTFVNYIPNTLKVNGLPNSSDINSGILIGSLAPYNTITSAPINTISFEVISTTAPALNPIANTAFGSYTFVPDPNTGTEISTGTESNQVLLTIIAADLISETPIKVSDTLVVSKTNPAQNFGNYSTILYNAGNVDALNVKIVDTLPDGLIFTPNSVTITGVDKNGNNVPLIINSVPPGLPLNIENGVVIADIPPGVTVTTKFGYTATTTAPDTIDNIANFDYSYIVNNTPVTKPNNQTTKSTIFAVNDSLHVTKTANPTSICSGQTLLYTVNIRNISGSTLNNIILQDTLPNSTSLVPSSFTLNFEPFTINGATVTSANLAQGINIGSITVADTVSAQYLVNVNTATSICDPNNCNNCNHWNDTTNMCSNTIPTTTLVNIANISYVLGTIPSQVFTSTVVTTVYNYCNKNCKPCCNQNSKPNCPHYNKPSCRPGRRQICRQIDCPCCDNNTSTIWNNRY